MAGIEVKNKKDIGNILGNFCGKIYKPHPRNELGHTNAP